MICDIRNIKNIGLVHDLGGLMTVLDTICDTYQFNILHKKHHIFYPQGLTIMYLLAESHISLHTFPENNHVAFDIYTCRAYPDNSVYDEIYDFLIQYFYADRDVPIILDR